MFSAFKRFGSYSTSAKALFTFCFFLLCASAIYMFKVKSFGQSDICRGWKDTLYYSYDKRLEEDHPWLEWACRLEIEWEKKNEYECKDQRHIANYEACFDIPYTPSPPCLVYSFGINYDFRFDDKMARLGCEVYSFDPSMDVKSHNRSKRVHFMNIGLGIINTDIFTPKRDGYTKNSKKKWQVKTLSAIKRMLGHQNKVIDVLKMDIESYEWKVIKQLLEDGSLKPVQQLLLEWHIFPGEPIRSDFPVMYETYLKLKEAGWRQFHSDKVMRWHRLDRFRSQMDNGLVNTRFDKI